ncbi:MAG TPA: N-acetyltransferase [Bryobacteraceae bacterium]
MNRTLTFRQETPEDAPGIWKVVQAAFERQGEADLVDGLRRSGALLLSAVAVNDRGIAGHVAFSRITVGESHEALALAPVAVAPDWQRLGIGSLLIRWALGECRQMGHGVVVVLGAPIFYQRFGFLPAARFGIECPFPVTPEHFMVLELQPGAAGNCRGTVRYAPEFNAL